MFLLIQTGDLAQGQFVLAETMTGEATEKNASEHAANSFIKGILNSPFVNLPGVLASPSTYNYNFETSFTEGMRSKYFTLVTNSDSWLDLPRSAAFYGASIKIYVDQNSTFGLKVKPEYLLNKKSFTIEVGQLVELVCINDEAGFLGWYIRE